MTWKNALCCGAAALFGANGANAATINLIDQGGVTGSQAEQGFRIAAGYWAGVLSSNATINLGVKFAPLATGIIGSTGSTRVDYSVRNWEARVNATKSNSFVDSNIVLPTLATNGGASFITNGTSPQPYTDPATGVTTNPNQDDLTKQVYDNAATVSSRTLYLNSSVVKAIGGTVAGVNAASIDGNVTFSSNFGFDFNPSDGISANTFDFIGVAIHEIGHALGFVSGVDFLDYYGTPNGPGRGTLGYSLNDTSIYGALDMFRYSTDPNNLVPGTQPALDLAVGGTKYFSVDGGATALYGNTFSTGSYNGDGRQASHWKDATGANACGPQLGIMDPTFCYAQMGEVTALDLAAFDAMGWNLSVPLDASGSYRKTTAQIYIDAGGAVPEPATWLMMIAGFGATGMSLRRRRTSIVVAA